MTKQERILLSGNDDLLNFARTPFKALDPFTWSPTIYDTMEHFFQAHKSLYVPRPDGAIHDWIIQPADPREVKSRGRDPRLQLNRRRWDREAFIWMLRGHMHKFQQHKKLRAKLRRTGDALLVEHRPDPIWGDNMDGSGQNLCGKSLMIVRDTILVIE